MTTQIPNEAHRVLDDGVLCYLAASTSNGPHLTPVVYAVDGGRLWVTTARRSVKARAWQRDPNTAGLIRSDRHALVFRGTVRTYDALDLSTWPGAAVAAPRLMSAAAKFSLKNARFFAGYAVDARRVPFAWSPPGRVFARIRLEAGRLLDVEGGAVVGGWGPWPEGTRYRAAFRTPPRVRGLDLGVPPRVRRALGNAGPGALALHGDGGLTVLPVGWRRVAAEGTHEARLPGVFASLAGTGAAGAGALTLDHASAWRASDMKGLLLQGTVELFSLDVTARGRRALAERVRPEEALAMIRPARVVWWEGWSSGTVRGRGTGDGKARSRRSTDVEQPEREP